MKFADKLKAVLALNPEINVRRRQLRAMAYLEKRNPTKYCTSISTREPISAYLHMMLNDRGETTITSIHNLKPMSAYPYTEGLKQLAEKQISGAAGVALDCVKKVFSDLCPNTAS